jgi:hypothetical protein
MAEKKWGYLIATYDENDNGGVGKIRDSFEAEGISPYKLVAGPYGENMKSEDYDQIKNPQAIGDFIRWIGDKNTLSVKKLRDPVINEFKEVNKNKEAFAYVGLAIVPLSTISPKLTGDARLKAMAIRYTEAVLLKNVSVTFIWSVTHIDVDPSYKSYKTTIYDYVTFEAEDVKFYFYDRDNK